MIIARDAETRRTAARILMAQAATTIVMAGLCALLWGRAQALSALAGGGTGLLANLFMTLSALRPAASPAGALGRVLLGQFMKVAVTVVLFVVAARTGKVVWPAMLAGYAATLLIFWIVPVLGTRPRRPKD